MLRRSNSQRFFGSFTSGFSKGFRQSGSGSTAAGGRGGFPGSFAAGSPGNGAFGGPLGGFLDKALEWCSESHARDIARRQGIDLKNIKFEKTPEGGMTVVVDAPDATPLQIEQLGHAVQEECPVARFRKTSVKSPTQQMKWVRLPDKYDR